MGAESGFHADGAVRALSDAELAALVPYPADDANKYTRGKVALCVGSEAYPGAALMAAQAVQLAGAGYTEVFTAPSNVSKIQIARASLVVRPFDSFDAADAVPSRNPGACLVGSGLDASDEDARRLFFSIVCGVSHTVVADAGALGFAACSEGLAALLVRCAAGRSCILTPHAGEAARLARAAGFALTGESLCDARALAKATGCAVALKGPDTVIAAPDGRRAIERTGTAALAKAGTGDVLAGVIAGLAGQGLDAFDAACLGVALHARAGRIAESRLGRVSVCPEDVLEAVPHAICSLRLQA